MVKHTLFLFQIENAGNEVADEIYETYTNLLVQKDETCQFCYKTYMVCKVLYVFIMYS